jgi:hypothetical protein
MSITVQNPRTIHLAGPITYVNTVPAGSAITPGMLIERYNNSGVANFRAHSSAAGAAMPTFALDQPELNKSYTDAYASPDLVKAGIMGAGALVYARIASGQTLVSGDWLESDGLGSLRKFGAGVKIAQAVESTTTTGAVGYGRVEIL